MQLAGKVAFITGAARGIGRACAARFAREGATVFATDVAAEVLGVPYPMGTMSQLQCTADLCRAEGAPAMVASMDVRDPSAIRDAVELCLVRFGHVDILLNSAGIAAPSGKPIHEIEEDEWAIMLDVDLSGSWRVLKAVAGPMLERRSGSIVNIASTAGMVGYRHFAAYVAAKHGIIGMTRAAALDFAPRRVRVNAVCPGSVRDEPELEGRMLAEIARSLSVSSSEHEELFMESQPMNRLVEARDVAGAAAWLASDDAAQITGSVVAVDGGFTAK